MRFWQGATIAILVGILCSALLYWISAPPRGAAVELIPPPTPASLRVQVDGAVAAPGMYEMPPGSRVDDLVSLAGGLTSDADVSGVNLAAVVQDAARIIEYREANGPFEVIEDIQKVKGIGPATFADLEGLITVSP